MLGVVPPRCSFASSEIGLDIHFSIIRGNTTLPVMDMIKWLDTNYYYIVFELGIEVKITYSSHKEVEEYKEAKEFYIHTGPMLIGPMSCLLLSKPAKNVTKTFNLLSLLDSILPIYKQVVAKFVAAGATWIQFYESSLGYVLYPKTQAHNIFDDEAESIVCYLLEIGTCSPGGESIYLMRRKYMHDYSLFKECKLMKIHAI
jgi:methionine synthase II (cobalamin-independent)